MTEKTFALIGNENCGKTTLFNALTGANQYVGNWPGVTVDQVIGKITKKDWDIVDLPGLYSLSPYSPEEIVSRNFLISGDHDVVLNIVDASHLERSLSLTLEVMAMGRPMVVALNMFDLVKDMNMTIDIKKLEEILGLKVVPISASNKTGLTDLLEAMEHPSIPDINKLYPEDVRAILKNVSSELENDLDEGAKTFIATSLLQSDKIYMAQYQGKISLLSEVAKGQNLIAEKYGTDAEAYFPQRRYEIIDGIISKCISHTSSVAKNITRSLDKLLLNPVLALPIFLAIVWVVYYIAVSTIGTMGTDYVNDVVFGEWATDGANALLEAAEAPEWLSSLVVDGVIGGVGAVLGFVPQMIVLFLMLSFLEQSGYMIRVAFILDRIFRHFGLSGRNFIPMVIANGCGVPALMAHKAIENINERRIGLITTTFVPCSAKLPIITMIFIAFFDGKAWFAPLIYALAILSIICAGIIFKKNNAFKEEVSPFVMEMPDYHMPTVYNILKATYNRCKAFVVKAGTIIFSVVVVVWFLSTFGFGADGFGMVDVDNSILASLGSAIAFIFIPLGFGTWQATVAIITGLLAKENVVGTLAVVLGLNGDFEGGEDALNQALHGYFGTSALLGFSFLAFNLFSTPCVAALGAMKRQLGNGKWFAFAVFYMTFWAYFVSLEIYQLGGLIAGTVSFNIFTVIALLLLVGFIYLLVRPDRKPTVGIRIPAKNI